MHDVTSTINFKVLYFYTGTITQTKMVSLSIVLVIAPHLELIDGVILAGSPPSSSCDQ